MGKATYLRRKSEGLCVRCGKPLEDDRKDKTTCSECRDKDNVRLQLIRDNRRKNGLCPRCGKVKLIGDEKNCPECSADNYTRRAAQRRNNPEQEKLIQEHCNENRRKMRRARKTEGLCVLCGKALKTADKGFVTCIYCRRKNSERLRVYRVPKPKTEYKQLIWQTEGSCPYCGKPLFGKYKVCEDHYKTFSEAGRKGKRNYGV